MKTRIWIKLLCFCTPLILFSCIDAYDPKLVGQERYLAFEGTLTDGPGPYWFTLSKSAGYNNTESVFDRRITGATVTVTDDTGQIVRFIDDSRGNYVSPTGFRGKVGRRYTLNLTYLGQSYRSDPELLQAVPPIDTVYWRYQPVKPKQDSNGDFAVYIDLKDPAGATNYYKWDWIHYERTDFCGTYTPPNSIITYKKPCCPSDCWIIARSAGEIILASDQFINGNKLTGLRVATIPFEAAGPYYLRIGQHSLSEKAYQYWQTVRSITSNVGGVFDVTPATLPGNLHNLKADGAPLVGYFQVSGVRERIVYINRYAPPRLPFAPTNRPYWDTCDPCVDGLYRTPVRPEGWRD